MSLRRLRSLLVMVAVAVAIAKALSELRPKEAPDVSRHPTVDGGRRAPTPAADPYQAPIVEPAAIDPALEPLPALDRPMPAPDLATEPAAGIADTVEPIGDRTWVAPVDGACPPGFPVKARLSSAIFHQPGQMAYDRTGPDRCYPNARAAEDDGLRAAKR